MIAQEDCASCTDERAAGAAFCENCGKALATGAGLAIGKDCPSCGAAGVVGDDGYCGNCGMLAARPRDHVEADAGAVAAAVTDRGLRHHRNEDAMWLATRGADVDVVVCDGVSASFDPDVASETAAEVTGKALTMAATGLAESIGAALVAAGGAVAGLATTGDPRRAASNPACTIVAACVRGTEIGYGWVGDSRAYWVPAEGDAVQLTEDDSWATHAIALGADPQAAWNDPKAHAITAWLGADAGTVAPRTGTFFAETTGHLVLCSDGLWNYLTEPAAFADTVRGAVRDTDGLLEAARSLVGFANAAGGSDNITVALVPLDTPHS
ncbi:PP2C family serine/threonine-protein phosphatase [Actinoplanes sp. NPDC049118]|uniref:PP2C family serine/threonine-protein phosphatase n=1 Tax=Actinoplanes sp. NPDC049118 TaxID=3155769 RepID=UPI0033D9802F